MSERQTSMSSRNRSNLVVGASCLAVFAAMVGVSFAAVPLYAMFCQVTGYGGTTQRVTQYSDTVLDRDITIRFDANVSGGLPWDFKPEQRDVTLKIGETTQIAYSAQNLFNIPTSGRASFNVSPPLAGSYFNKVECFCFTDTTLKPGETLDMPVVFYIDPEIVNQPELAHIKTITLSYTFFPIEPESPVAAKAGQKQQTDDTTSIGG